MNQRIQTEPFFFPGGEPGVLLIHGFLTAPSALRPLGEHLAAAGMTVLGLRLRGHGTHPDDLRGVCWQDWVADVQAGVAQLRESCAHVAVVGSSLGSVLALYVAAEDAGIERLVACSTPDARLLLTRGMGLTPLLARFVPTLPKFGSDVRDPVARRARFVYRRVPLAAAAQLPPLLRETATRLPHVTAPTLLIQARRDRVVPWRAAVRIAAQLGGPAHIQWLERGGHTVVLDYDHALVFEATRRWLEGNGEWGMKNLECRMKHLECGMENEA